MDDVRRDANNIKSAITKEIDGSTSPERQRAVYKYPFSSPIQQVSMSPSREITQTTPTPQASVSLSREITQAIPARQASVSLSREITQAIESSTENILVTARLEMLPSRKIITIESSPVPITLDPNPDKNPYQQTRPPNIARETN